MFAVNSPPTFENFYLVVDLNGKLYLAYRVAGLYSAPKPSGKSSVSIARSTIRSTFVWNVASPVKQVIIFYPL